MFQYYNANCHIGSKRKRMGPKTLNNYIVNTSTSDQYISYENTIQSTAEDYFRTNFFYNILDVVITNFKKRFSPESLKMASSIDHFFNLNFNDGLHFINHYHVNT